MPKLKNWGVVYADEKTYDGYKAPEQRPKAVKGAVYGHPTRPDGEVIRTSRVVGITGKSILTQSGSIYDLEDPDPEYIALLKEHGKEFDPERPIYFLRNSNVVNQ